MFWWQWLHIIDNNLALSWNFKTVTPSLDSQRCSLLFGVHIASNELKGSLILEYCQYLWVVIFS
jgi:hypothetical protein